MWEQEKMQSLKDVSRGYNNKDVLPTLEAVQKIFQYYHNKGIDMLRIGCTLPDLAIICLNNYTSAKFYPFGKSDTDLLSKFREDMDRWPLKVFTRKTVNDETLIHESTNFYKLIVGIDASQLYNCTRC